MFAGCHCFSVWHVGLSGDKLHPHQPSTGMRTSPPVRGSMMMTSEQGATRVNQKLEGSMVCKMWENPKIYAVYIVYIQRDMDCNGLLINQFLIFHRNFLWCLSHLNKR